MRQNIMPILEAKKVDLVLSGHSHSYERSMLIRGHFGLESTFNTSTMAVNSGSGIAPSVYTKTSPNYYGTVYAVVGVSGQKGSTTSGYPHNAMYTSSVTYYGSAVIDVVGNQLNFKFLTSAVLSGISSRSRKPEALPPLLRILPLNSSTTILPVPFMTSRFIRILFWMMLRWNSAFPRTPVFAWIFWI